MAAGRCVRCRGAEGTRGGGRRDLGHDDQQSSEQRDRRDRSDTRSMPSPIPIPRDHRCRPLPSRPGASNRALIARSPRASLRTVRQPGWLIAGPRPAAVPWLSVPGSPRVWRWFDHEASARAHRNPMTARSSGLLPSVLRRTAPERSRPPSTAPRRLRNGQRRPAASLSLTVRATIPIIPLGITNDPDRTPRIALTTPTTRELVSDRRDQYAFHDDIVYLQETKRGLTRDTVEEISAIKGEPEWMLALRLRAYDHFLKRPMPVWTDGLDRIDFDKIVYYRKPSEREEKSWDDVPEQIKATFEKLGIPEAERKFLAGVGAQYDSEVVYHNVREELTKIGVVFMGTDQGLKEYPEIFKQYFGTVVPAEDNKFSALNGAVWSGGSFVYVPKGVEVPLPLQAYFRINGENTGQFERTLIVVDEGAQVHYIEGCTAPIYATDSLHV